MEENPEDIKQINPSTAQDERLKKYYRVEYKDSKTNQSEKFYFPIDSQVGHYIALFKKSEKDKTEEEKTFNEILKELADAKENDPANTTLHSNLTLQLGLFAHNIKINQETVNTLEEISTNKNTSVVFYDMLTEYMATQKKENIQSLLNSDLETLKNLAANKHNIALSIKLFMQRKRPPASVTLEENKHFAQILASLGKGKPEENRKMAAHLFLIGSGLSSQKTDFPNTYPLSECLYFGQIPWKSYPALVYEFLTDPAQCTEAHVRKRWFKHFFPILWDFGALSSLIKKAIQQDKVDIKTNKPAKITKKPARYLLKYGAYYVLLDKTLGEGGYGRTCLAYFLDKNGDLLTAAPAVAKIHTLSEKQTLNHIKSEALIGKKSLRTSEPIVYQTLANGKKEYLTFMTYEPSSLTDKDEQGNEIDPYKALEKLLADKNFDVRIDLCIQLLKSVKNLEDDSLVHADIKLENFQIEMVTDENGFVRFHAVPVDFGLAKSASDEKGFASYKMGGVVGTTDHISPEMLRQERGYPGSTDLYALAPLIMAILGAENPFWGEHLSATDICSEKSEKLFKYNKKGLLEHFEKDIPEEFIYLKSALVEICYALENPDHDNRISPNDALVFFSHLAILLKISKLDSWERESQGYDEATINTHVVKCILIAERLENTYKNVDFKTHANLCNSIIENYRNAAGSSGLRETPFKKEEIESTPHPLLHLQNEIQKIYKEIKNLFDATEEILEENENNKLYAPIRLINEQLRPLYRNLEKNSIGEFLKAVETIINQQKFLSIENKYNEWLNKPNKAKEEEIKKAMQDYNTCLFKLSGLLKIASELDEKLTVTFKKPESSIILQTKPSSQISLLIENSEIAYRKINQVLKYYSYKKKKDISPEEKEIINQCALAQYDLPLALRTGHITKALEVIDAILRVPSMEEILLKIKDTDDLRNFKIFLTNLKNTLQTNFPQTGQINNFIKNSIEQAIDEKTLTLTDQSQIIYEKIKSVYLDKKIPQQYAHQLTDINADLRAALKHGAMGKALILLDRALQVMENISKPTAKLRQDLLTFKIQLETNFPEEAKVHRQIFEGLPKNHQAYFNHTFGLVMDRFYSEHPRKTYNAEKMASFINKTLRDAHFAKALNKNHCLVKIYHRLKTPPNAPQKDPQKPETFREYLERAFANTYKDNSKYATVGEKSSQRLAHENNVAYFSRIFNDFPLPVSPLNKLRVLINETKICLEKHKAISLDRFSEYLIKKKQLATAENYKEEEKLVAEFKNIAEKIMLLGCDALMDIYTKQFKPDVEEILKEKYPSYKAAQDNNQDDQANRLAIFSSYVMFALDLNKYMQHAGVYDEKMTMLIGTALKEKYLTSINNFEIFIEKACTHHQTTYKKHLDYLKKYDTAYITESFHFVLNFFQECLALAPDKRGNFRQQKVIDVIIKKATQNPSFFTSNQELINFRYIIQKTPLNLLIKLMNEMAEKIQNTQNGAEKKVLQKSQKKLVKIILDEHKNFNEWNQISSNTDLNVFKANLTYFSTKKYGAWTSFFKPEKQQRKEKALKALNKLNLS